MGGDLKAVGNIQSTTNAYLQSLRDTSKSSLDYDRAFQKVQIDLAAVNAKAAPTLEQLTGDGFKVSNALQREIDDSQAKALKQLEDLNKLTATWQKELQDKLTEQSLIFVNIGLTNEMIAANTANLDSRITAAIIAAQGAQAQVNALIPKLGPSDDYRTIIGGGPGPAKIIPPYIVPVGVGLGAGGNPSKLDEMVTEIKGLRADTSAVKAELVEIKKTNRDMFLITDRNVELGTPTYTVAAPS